MIEVGSVFPDFSLTDQEGETHSRKDFGGAKTVFYFYPKDDTSGCTAEACEFRDLVPDIKGARIVGISPDGQKSHKKFVDKHSLNFTLLSDTDHKLVEQLGIWVEKSLYGRKYMGVERTTYLVDTDGTILHIWRKVKPQGHAAEVQALLNS